MKHRVRPVPGYPEPLVDRIAWGKAYKADFYAIKALPETQALADAVYQRHGSRRPRHARTRTSNGPPKTPRPTPPKAADDSDDA